MINDKYEDNKSVIDSNLYEQEFRCGADVNVFFNDVLVPISGFIYRVQEQLRPINGYASYTYDDVAVGSRIILGTFKVPINNPNPSNLKDKIVNSSVTYTVANDYLAAGNNNIARENISDSYPEKVPDWINEQSINNSNIDNDTNSVSHIPVNPSMNLDNNSYKNTNTFPNTPYTDDNPDLTLIQYTIPENKSDFIGALQQKLKSLGYIVNINNIYDAVTANAILQYKKDHNIKDTTTNFTQEVKDKIFGSVSYGYVSIPKDSKNKPCLKTAPLDSAPVISIIDNNTKVVILSYTDKNYYKVNINGKIGYIEQYYIIK